MDWNTLPLTMAAAALTFTSAPASAQEAAPAVSLAPTAAWTLNYDDDSCALVRTFGSESAPDLFELRQYAPGSPIIATFASQRDAARASDAPVAYLLPANQRATFGRSRELDLGNGYRGVRIILTLQAPGPAAAPLVDDPARNALEASIEGVALRGAFADDLAYATGPMNPPLAALRECEADLVAGWGLDAQAHRTLTRQVTPVDSEDLSERAFARIPRSLFRQIGSNPQLVLLMVDQTGDVTDCRQLLPAMEDRAVELFCRFLGSDGLFQPALDAAGNPIASYFVFGWTGAAPFVSATSQPAG